MLIDPLLHRQHGSWIRMVYCFTPFVKLAEQLLPRVRISTCVELARTRHRSLHCHAVHLRTAKIAMRTMWTGRPTDDMPEPCEYIYEQQPGLVPFVDRNGTVRPRVFTGSVSAPCDTREGPCETGGGGPNQAAGLQFMWTQSLISSYIRYSWAGCDKPGQPKIRMTYPGQPKAEFDESNSVQHGNMASMFWMCQRVIDPIGGTCTAIFNYEICDDINNEDCYAYLTFPIETKLADLYDNAPSEYEKWQMRKEFPNVERYDELITQVAKQNGKDQDDEWVPGESFPSLTEELLEKMCAADVALMTVVSEALVFALDHPEKWEHIRKNNFYFYAPDDALDFAKCNHVVFLQSCNYEDNNYVLWSWGVTIKMTREILIGEILDRHVNSRSNSTFTTGIACSAVVAHQVSVP